MSQVLGGSVLRRSEGKSWNPGSVGPVDVAPNHLSFAAPMMGSIACAVALEPTAKLFVSSSPELSEER